MYYSNVLLHSLYLNFLFEFNLYFLDQNLLYRLLDMSLSASKPKHSEHAVNIHDYDFMNCHTLFFVNRSSPTSGSLELSALKLRLHTVSIIR